MRLASKLAGALIALSALFWSVGAHSAPAEDSTPAQDLVDDKLLAQATHEVDAMNPQQLEAFIDYLAYCGTKATVVDLYRLAELPEAKNRDFLCDVATRKFEIKNAGAAALGRLARALDIYWRIALLNNPTSEDMRSFQRRTDIFRTLQSSASARYTELLHAASKARSSNPE
jgi:hypothetical protein